MEHRLDHAAHVALAVGADTVVCSGGIDREHDQRLPSEGEIMAAWMEASEVIRQARSTGRTRVAILAESTSTSTRENAIFSLQLLAAQVRSV